MKNNKIIDEEIKKFKEQYPLLEIQQVYSGYITDISTKCYSVYLEDCTEYEDLTAEMYKDKFPESDLPLGRIFYWFLGLDENKEGFGHIQLSTATWTQEMIDNAKAEGEILYAKFSTVNKIAD